MKYWLKKTQSNYSLGLSEFRLETQELKAAFVRKRKLLHHLGLYEALMKGSGLSRCLQQGFTCIFPVAGA